jgi:hypothetical protein
MQLYNTIIHRDNNQWLLECLENYKYKFNTTLQQWSEQPVHDKYSHMMDALRYAVQATKELEFFGDSLYDTNERKPSVSYTEDWSKVWA